MSARVTQIHRREIEKNAKPSPLRKLLNTQVTVSQIFPKLSDNINIFQMQKTKEIRRQFAVKMKE